MLILIIILVLVLGGGGGFYGHSRWGYGGGAGMTGNYFADSVDRLPARRLLLRTRKLPSPHYS